VTLIAYKRERQLEVWGRESGDWSLISTYRIRAASGARGPKLRQGDFQVPEGEYRLTLLNPNSSYHLSIRVDYPNARDRRFAGRDRRTNLGGDIYIHGKAVSIGCLAMGDAAIEDLFLLVAETGLRSCRILIAPDRKLETLPPTPPWADELYDELRPQLAAVTGQKLIPPETSKGE
jgi:murein L,D-transpeptidase YafK